VFNKFFKQHFIVFEVHKKSGDAVLRLRLSTSKKPMPPCSRNVPIDTKLSARCTEKNLLPLIIGDPLIIFFSKNENGKLIL